MNSETKKKLNFRLMEALLRSRVPIVKTLIWRSLCLLNDREDLEKTDKIELFLAGELMTMFEEKKQ